MQRSKKSDNPGQVKPAIRFPVFVPMHEEVVIELIDVESPRQRKRALITFCNNVEALVSVVHSSQYEDNKLNAVVILAKIVNKLTNEDALTFVALYSQDLSARLTAVEKLKDSYDALVIVSEQSEYSETRMLAKQMLIAHGPGRKAN